MDSNLNNDEIDLNLRAYPRRSLMLILSFIASLFVSVIGLLVFRAFKQER